MPTIAVWQLRTAARSRALISVGILLATVILVTVVGAFVVSFAWPTPAVATPDTHFHVGNVEDFAVGQPTYFKRGDFWLVHEADGSYKALLALDTRLSTFDTARIRCPLRWLPEYASSAQASQVEQLGFFKADCTGSVFTLEGKRVFGPSPRDLDTLPVVVSSKGDIAVNTARDRLIRGHDWFPAY